MCSKLDEGFNPEDVKSDLSCNQVDLSCKKCSQKAVIRLQKRHSYCRNCFLDMVTHKFRSTLGKTRLLKPDDRVLTVFLGNSSSLALLHFLQQGIKERTHKKLRFHPIILFIDESTLCSKETGKSEILEILQLLKLSDFESYVIKLNSIYNNMEYKNVEAEDISNYLVTNDDDGTLLSLFGNVKSNTSKIDLLWQIRYRITIGVARLLKCNKILTPENGTNLSVRLLSNVILGRGSQIPSDITVCDQKIQDVYVIRPLREITAKELIFFNVYNNAKFYTVVPDFLALCSSVALQQETVSFIHRLQEEFPSTVYTVFHIGEKLKITNNGDNESACCWCYNSLSSTKSTTDCLKLNKNTVMINFIEEKLSKNLNCHECSCKREDKFDMPANFKFSLCYGCQRILNEMESINYLPNCLSSKMELRLRTNEMKKSIQDFLL